MDKLKLVKLVFYADREHLASYGRPIVGGLYYTMEHGPVHSQILDLLINAQSGEEVLPFQGQGEHNIVSKETPDTKWFSESDLDVLDEIYRLHGHKDQFVLRKMTHKLKSYQKNKPQPGHLRNPLPYEGFFEDFEDNDKAKNMFKIILDEQQASADFM